MNEAMAKEPKRHQGQNAFTLDKITKRGYYHINHGPTISIFALNDTGSCFQVIQLYQKGMTTCVSYCLSYCQFCAQTSLWPSPHFGLWRAGAVILQVSLSNYSMDLGIGSISQKIEGSGMPRSSFEPMPVYLYSGSTRMVRCISLTGRSYLIILHSRRPTAPHHLRP